MLRLPPIPAPTLASDGDDPDPRMVRTDDLSASMFDFRTEVAICCWYCRPASRSGSWPNLLHPYVHSPITGRLSGETLTNAGNGRWRSQDLTRRNRLVAAIN